MLKERFIEYLRFEKRFSLNTLRSYENDLDQFAGFLKDSYQIAELTLADHQMIRSWVVGLLEGGISARSVNRKLSTLKSFFHFCQRIGEVKTSPMLKVISPRTAKQLPVFIDKDKLDELFTSIPFPEGFEGTRDKLMLMMLYATGMRRSELLGIRIPDIDFGKSMVKVLGKRNKERIIPLGDYLCRELDIYTKVREEFIKSHHPESDIQYLEDKEKRAVLGIDSQKAVNNRNTLFVSKNGQPLSARQLYAIVHHYLAQVSSQAKLSPHVLRHTFATHMLDDGAELNAIKEILGHTSLAATQVYTHNTIEKLKMIYKQAHPRA